MFSKTLAGVAGALALIVTASVAPAQMAKDYDMPERDIVQVAAEAGTFNTLIAAAKAADLVDALKGEGPLTVFAPTDLSLIHI